MSRAIRTAGVALALSIAVLAAAAAPRAQRPSGGGGFSGASQTRLTLLTAAFKLTDDQKKAAKNVLDEEFKAAAALRTALATARTPIGEALEAAKDQTVVDETVAAYAAAATDMAMAESHALARLVHALTPDQQADKTALATAVSLMRGAFVGKKWDTAPDQRFY